MKQVRFFINGFLALWFADRAGCGDINPWLGTFVGLVFLRECYREVRRAVK